MNLVAGALRLPPDARLRSVVQAGAGRGRRALPARAERGRGDAGPARRLRLQPVPDVRQRQRGGVRPGRVVGHRSAAPAAGPALQLRPEGRRLRSAGLRRPADDRPGADRAAALGPRAAGLHGGRRRHQPVGPDDGRLQGRRTRQRLRDLRDQLQVGRPQPERRADRRARTGRCSRPRRSSPRTCVTSRSASRPSRSAASPRTSPPSTPTIKDFQAQVVNASVGVLRGYLANAEKVRVRGVEFDGSARVGRTLSLYGAAAYTDGTLRLVPRRAAAARGHRRPAGEGHLRLGPAGHLEVGALVRRRVRARRRASSAAPGEFFGALRHQLSLVVLVERQRLAVSGRRRLLAAQRARRLPLGRRLDALALVAQPARQGLLRAADRGARQHRPLRRPARRRQDRRADDEVHVQRKVRRTRTMRSTPCSSSLPRRR